jgi:hypothetical protein
MKRLESVAWYPDPSIIYAAPLDHFIKRDSADGQEQRRVSRWVQQTNFLFGKRPEACKNNISRHPVAPVALLVVSYAFSISSACSICLPV